MTAAADHQEISGPGGRHQGRGRMALEGLRLDIDLGIRLPYGLDRGVERLGIGHRVVALGEGHGPAPARRPVPGRDDFEGGAGQFGLAGRPLQGLYGRVRTVYARDDAVLGRCLAGRHDGSSPTRGSAAQPTGWPGHPHTPPAGKRGRLGPAGLRRTGAGNEGGRRDHHRHHRGDMSLLVATPEADRRDPGARHPEASARLVTAVAALGDVPDRDAIVRLPPRLAAPAELALVHDPGYLEALADLWRPGADPWIRTPG